MNYEWIIMNWMSGDKCIIVNQLWNDRRCVDEGKTNELIKLNYN